MLVCNLSKHSVIHFYAFYELQTDTLSTLGVQKGGRVDQIVYDTETKMVPTEKAKALDNTAHKNTGQVIWIRFLHLNNSFNCIHCLALKCSLS